MLSPRPEALHAAAVYRRRRSRLPLIVIALVIAMQVAIVPTVGAAVVEAVRCGHRPCASRSVVLGDRCHAHARHGVRGVVASAHARRSVRDRAEPGRHGVHGHLGTVGSGPRRPGPRGAVRRPARVLERGHRRGRLGRVHPQLRPQCPGQWPDRVRAVRARDEWQLVPVVARHDGVSRRVASRRRPLPRRRRHQRAVRVVAQPEPLPGPGRDDRPRLALLAGFGVRRRGRQPR